MGTSEPYYESVGCIHVHTRASDGAGTYAEVARIATKVGLHFLVITDHNILAKQEEGYRQGVLFLVDQEVHDVRREPEKSHYLCLAVTEDVTAHAAAPQAVVDAVRAQGGLGFIAHPFERITAFSGEPDIGWVDWDVQGFTGLEIWNYMSEFKAYLPDLAHALFMVYFPKVGMLGPFPETLACWDDLLRHRKVVAIGGLDAHANVYRRGPLARPVLSYEFLFRAVRMHLLTSQPLTGDFARDRALVYSALGAGHSFVAYDLLADATGFRFSATSGGRTVGMGEDLALSGGAELEVVSPRLAELRIVNRGQVVARTLGRRLSYVTHEPGAYRTEAYRWYLFRRRGWVFTNPIYLRWDREEDSVEDEHNEDV